MSSTIVLISGANRGLGKGLLERYLAIEESCDAMVKLIDAATKELHGGKFWNFDGKQETW